MPQGNSNARQKLFHAEWLTDIIIATGGKAFYHISGLLRSLGVNIESMETKTYSAPVSGTPLFQLDAELAIPAVPSEPMIRVEALRKLRILVAGEIDRIESLLADGVR